MKTRTEQHAAAFGRPGIWTWPDVNAARLLANKAIDPKRPRAPTPDETWALRTAIRPDERHRFRLAVADQRKCVADEQAIVDPMDYWTATAADREALQRVLVGHAYLLFKRRRIPARI